MYKAYFFKVDSSTSLLSLMHKTRRSTFLCKKTLQYKCVCEILLSEKEFDDVCNKILYAASYCSKYSYLSITDSKGIRNCIELLCNSRTYRIIIFTAGNKEPLYAAVTFKNKQSRNQILI